MGNPAQVAAAKTRLRQLLADIDRAEPDVADVMHESIWSESTSGQADGLAAVARLLLKESDLRGSYFRQTPFSDPAWHILLDLFIAAVEKKDVSVSSLCVAARVPSSTALRWIKHLADEGLVGRSADQEDRRRSFVRIEPRAFADMAAYLIQISRLRGGG
ncbi:MAG TPA: MarR family transcriptional regulator [Sphingobium sp.]